MTYFNTPGLAPGWDPGNAILGDVNNLVFVFEYPWPTVYCFSLRDMLIACNRISVFKSNLFVTKNSLSLIKYKNNQILNIKLINLLVYFNDHHKSRK